MLFALLCFALLCFALLRFASLRFASLRFDPAALIVRLPSLRRIARLVLRDVQHQACAAPRHRALGACTALPSCELKLQVKINVSVISCHFS